MAPVGVTYFSIHEWCLYTFFDNQFFPFYFLQTNVPVLREIALCEPCDKLCMCLMCVPCDLCIVRVCDTIDLVIFEFTVPAGGHITAAFQAFNFYCWPLQSMQCYIYGGGEGAANICPQMH